MKTLIVLSTLLLSGCAVLHHVQLSDIDNRSQFVMVPIEVKVSETGVDIGDAKAIAQGVMTSKANQDAAGDIATFIQMMQMGPRTGAPVYSDKYAEKMIYQLHTQCPSGKITGVQSIRESREYPVIKGEIIKITGFCLREKGS
ncbi:hypothetical protein [Bdellovibrio sp. HCB337]|uniref:hypothetical protein n=1 Tax=Bdellovibrio sp. HCB337 TaxID=3394358 RepID=UPI0039A6EA4C